MGALISCSEVSFTVLAFKSKMEGRDGEAEPGSVAPDTPEKISRGLHPPPPLMPERIKQTEVSLCHRRLVCENIKTKHSKGT